MIKRGAGRRVNLRHIIITILLIIALGYAGIKIAYEIPYFKKQLIEAMILNLKIRHMVKPEGLES